MTQATQEFATPQEALEHYGVKGMKWGVTNADRPSSNDIHDARARLAIKNRDYQKERKAIKKDKVALPSRRDRKEAIGDLKIKTLSDPDRQTAFRLTTGEKAVYAMLAIAAPPTAIGVAVGRASVNRQLKDAAAQQRLKESQKS